MNKLISVQLILVNLWFFVSNVFPLRIYSSAKWHNSYKNCLQRTWQTDLLLIQLPKVLTKKIQLLSPKNTSKRKSKKKIKKCCEIVFWKKSTDFEKFVAHQLNEVLYHFTSIWIEEKLMKKYINHGRSKIQGMYLKFPIFLITFDIIKEKELHQSIKTAKGRVKKREGWCGTLSKHLILSSINWNSLRVTKQNQNGYTTRLDNMIEMTKGTLSVANDPNTVEICQENPRWKLGEGGGAVWCIEWWQIWLRRSTF